MSNLVFPIQIGKFEDWVKECLDLIESNASEDVAAAVADFSVTGVLTERRTLDAGTATLPQVRDVLCTLIVDIQKRGQKRSA